MKFTHQLKFNCAPEWKDYYIHYSVLKKLIYQIGGDDIRESAGIGPAEQEPLLPVIDKDEKERQFESLLNTELTRILDFYTRTERELFSQLEGLGLEIREYEEGRLPTTSEGLETELDGRRRFWSSHDLPKDLKAAKDSLAMKLEDLYEELNNLLEYITLNHTGFRKILKKHDKVTQRELKSQYMPLVEAKLVHNKKERVQERIDQVVHQYAVIVCNGHEGRALTELRKKLRDHLVFERQTVWQDMVAIERRTAAAQVSNKAPEGGKGPRKWCQRLWSPLAIGASLLVLALLLRMSLFDEPAKQNCFAMLVFCSMLWCSEAVPLFVTSMMVPFLVVVLRVLTDGTPERQRQTPTQAAGAIFHAMFSQTIMLLLGGFTIAAALSKHFIAKQLAAAILSRVGRKPATVLLTSMMVATFASMWISNVAAPVLCFSLMQTILRTLSPSHPFAKSLVLGIALASNIGGMTSPIASPQNIFAVERMSLHGSPPGWLSWFGVAIPVSILSNLLVWAVILVVYRPGRYIKEVRPLKAPEDPLTGTQMYVIGVSLLTVVLWCCNSFLQKYTGEMGVLALLPMIAFFGFGILNKDDFNGFLWNVVMLAMGGLALGEAVKSSGLLASIAQGIEELVQGMSLYQVSVVFGLMVLVCTTFISHTVGAMVILPIVQSVGERMSDPHPNVLVMSAALLCSCAMGLPVSGFPNMNAVALEDPTGQNYVGTIDFLKVGLVSSFLAYGVVTTLGYALMRITGF